MSLTAIFVAIAAASAAPQNPPVEPEAIKGPIRMKMSEIRAYNSKLPPDHPNYIRCVSAVVTGSLARRVKTCRTNQEWARVNSAGNDDARAFVESKQTGWSNGLPPGP